MPKQLHQNFGSEKKKRKVTSGKIYSLALLQFRFVEKMEKLLPMTARQGLPCYKACRATRLAVLSSRAEPNSVVPCLNQNDTFI